MEPEVSIEGSAMIQVAVLPVGAVPPNSLRDYYSMLLPLHTIPLSAIRSFYTEHQKSPFANQPWDSGFIRFKFVLGGNTPSPWEDFQSHRKTLTVVGLCHCPSSPDLDLVIDQFNASCRSYPSSLVHRCFAFCPNDSQLEEGGRQGGNLRLFPPADRPTLEFHLHTMMQEIAASLLMEFEKWVLKAESSGTILKTPLDSQAGLSSEEVIKAKKRRLGRAQKTIGDYCLLAGSPVDANAHYSTALELCRLTGDYFWYAGALEGSVCALLIDRMGQKDSVVEEEVRYRYSSVILNYKKSQDNTQRVSPITFELEATLKLARFLCRRELAKEVVELLTTAADGAKSLIDASDRLVLYIEIARLYGNLGYQRKAAFFSRQVAQLYLQQENRLAAISAMQVLAMTTKAYHVQSRSSISDHSQKNKGNGDSGKTYHQSAVSLFESQWSTLQMVVLREILLSAVRAGDPLTAWSAAARLLRHYYPLITPSGQNGLANALSNSADRLPPGTRCADPALPFIRLHSFPLLPIQMDIVKRNPSRPDWWAGSAPSGPFIYTPFSKGDSNIVKKQELIWVVGEPVQVMVELANPCGFDLRVDSIYLSVHSGNFDAFPMSLKNVTVPNISVVTPLPLLVSRVVGGDGAIILYEGEIRDIWISLANAGTVAIEQAHISLSGKNQDSVISYSSETLKSSLPLKPGAEVTIRVTLRAWQVGSVDADAGAGKAVSGSNVRHIKDGSSPSLLIHYAGPLQTTEDTLANASTVPPGRRLAVPLQICVLQGLSFVKAQLLSMEFPAHVGENLPKVDDLNSTEGHFDSTTNMEKLVKINPSRGSWGLRFLELELSNPTDIAFEINVSIKLDKSGNEENRSADQDASEHSYPKTRIERDCSARVLVPLKHFKLPVLDDSFFMKDNQADSRSTPFSEKNTKAELNACIKNLISRIKVRWHSGRNSTGELNIKDAIQAALQTSIMDVLLPDPLTFMFRLTGHDVESEKIDTDKESNIVESPSKGSVIAHEMTTMEVLVRNNTKDKIKINFNITCRDVAGENCVDGTKATVLWTGVLSDITLEIPPLQQIKHPFCLHFLVPGEYTLLAAAVIDDPSDILRARAKTASPSEPIFCRGPPYHVRVHGTA
ncbi:hypothetical protein PIB30_075638 [Stylosanthes scabra]|uniref:Trafficking protein particle complex II-specific subunit 120 homolog n=1 Tax=Stylosanthes scabra TaxID=79078 RepID=A0ABU6TRI6_9FABA|nr:hypothetical protein [Stylosanthes scabra]